ncbi:MAG: universal stress protein [Planctomycetota bacterium]
MRCGTILVPTDFSENSLIALRFAAGFAKAFNSRIILLHVAEMPPEIVDLPDSPPSQARLLSGRRVLERGRAELDRARLQIPELEAVPVEVQMRAGAAAPEILLEAEEKSAALIILATHGRSGLSRLVLGSVTERIVRGAPCPVLSIRPPHLGPTAGGATRASDPVDVEQDIRRLLLPTDFSRASLTALDAAGELVERLHATLDLIYVMEDLANFPLISWEHAPGVTPDEFYANSARRARQRLCRLLKEDYPSVRVKNIFIGHGHPVMEVVNRAEEGQYDLVVLSAHGRSGVKRALLGSVAEKIVRKAPCAVLAVRGTTGAA